jgi:hypothetical protein
MRTMSLKAAILAAIFVGGHGGVIAAQTATKPPAQVVNLADVRRQAAACESYAKALEAATAGLRDGSVTVEAGEEIRRHRAVVDPLCARQDAPSAGANVATINARTNDIRSLLP